MTLRRHAPATLLVVFAALPAFAQTALEDIPGHDRYEEIRRAARSLVTGGTISRVRWDVDGGVLRFRRDGEPCTFDLETLALADAADAVRDDDDGDGGGRGRRRGFPGRGRQRDRETSPDGAWTAVCRDYNVVLEDADGEVVREITTDGERKHRFGMASWVYGEELRQRSAMWWSPDSRWLVFYEFDERDVADYHLLRGWTELRTEVLREGYPKPGGPNPVARLHVFDVESGERTAIDTGPSGDEDIGHYVYGVRFTPDGERILFFRTNRHQNRLELVAADPLDGTTRVVVREEQDTWQKNRPTIEFLEDGERFVWETERTGYRHFELRNLEGEHLATLTSGEWPAGAIVEVDEADGYLYYTAASGESPLNMHLHRVGLDGEGDTRLTSEPADHQAFSIAPGGGYFVARHETMTEPPVTALYDRSGRRLAVLAESDTSRLKELDVTPAEPFSFLADDHVTRIYGVLFKPTGFTRRRSYPLIVDVYGGPQSRRVRNRFEPVHALCELGFLVARIDNRGTTGRGKAFESANYLALGTVDLQDQADGVRYLAQRPYVDGSRVGIYGHSYGGYMAALAILKHPDVFHVSVASSPVTDWRNYDTIYTERYMRTPEENSEGYEQGSCTTFAGGLRGNLLIMHGLVDDNVHPTNVFQLADALDQADKRFDLFLYPERGHGLGRTSGKRRIEFLYHHLVGKRLF